MGFSKRWSSWKKTVAVEQQDYLRNELYNILEHPEHFLMDKANCAMRFMVDQSMCGKVCFCSQRLFGYIIITFM